jgi:hypothetical protein
MNSGWKSSIRHGVIVASAFAVVLSFGLGSLLFCYGEFLRRYGLDYGSPLPNFLGVWAALVVFCSLMAGLVAGLITWLLLMKPILSANEKEFYYDGLSEVPILTRIYRKACRRVWRIDR